MSFLKAIVSWGYSFVASRRNFCRGIILLHSCCDRGLLSLVVVITVCYVGMASTELVWIVAGPLALASEVEKCTSVDALDKGLISCVCLGLMKLVFHQYSAPLSSTK